MTKKLLFFLTVIVLVSVGAVAGILVLRGNENKPVAQNSDSYRLNLQSGTKYPVRKATLLTFDIRSQNNHILKDLDVVHTKKMHLIVVRTDRTNFQHVHPTFNESSGMFKMDSFIFPTDGNYRVFADFTPSSAQPGPETKLPVTLYQDVQVGDMDQYKPQPLGKDRLESNMNGFDTGFFISPDDDSPDIVGDTFYSEQTSVIVIYIDKNGQSFENLQTYLGTLGHMVVFGPKLEFIHAHPVNQDIKNQQGLIGFEVNFPNPGKYKIYLQAKAGNRVNTFDYNLTVLAGAGGQNGQAKSGENTDVQGMEGMQH